MDTTIREETIARAFSSLDCHLRQASIAQIGGFRPPTDPITSWFGGHFVGRADEEWPTNHNGPMLPIIQVRLDEVPVVPPALSGIALLSVFVDSVELPVDTPVESGYGWLIRTYETLDSLVPTEAGTPFGVPLRPFPILWSKSLLEGPCWEDGWSVSDLTAFNALPDSIELYHDRYKRHYNTKIGGWPAYIQGAPSCSADHFAFQVGSEEKPRWMWGDNGTGYFFRTGPKQWQFHWDCY